MYTSYLLDCDIYNLKVYAWIRCWLRDSKLLNITGSPQGFRCSSAKIWTFNPSPNSQLLKIDLKFDLGHYVREVTNHAKVGLGPMSSRAATWGQHIRVLWLFCFFYSSTELQSIPVNYFSHTIAQKTRSGVRKTCLWWEMCSCEIWCCFTIKHT